jgi:two-component system, OmpR family, sensor histidine kinase VicK
LDKSSVPIKPPQSGTINERTEVYYGSENVLNAELRFFANSKQKIDSCMNYTRPELVIEIEQIKKAFIDIKTSRRKVRYLTEITSENISFCKELVSIVDELRHLDDIKGNFMISESEYLAPLILYRKGEIASQIIYSNVKELVEHQQYIFDSFWSKGIPAEQRIREIEEGVEPLETKVFEDKDKIFNHMNSVLETASERSVCSSLGGMQLIYNNFFDKYKKIIDKQRKGQGRGVRWIISIDRDSVNLVKTFLKEGIQVRHVKNLTPMNFAVDNKHFYATIDRMEEGKVMQSLLVSNEPAYISHYSHIFEELWKNGVDAMDRIKDIEEEVDLSDIEVIPSSARAQEMYLDIVRSAKEEILWIFPTTNAFVRQDKIGAIPLAIQVARLRNVKVRILTPADSQVEQRIKRLKEYYWHPDNHTVVDVRYIEQMSETKATIVVVDRKASLVMELRDDTKTTFIEAIGLSTYSNSVAGVLSYVAIFENLWRQSELYQQVKKSNEQLKVHGRMQREFIDIAAHELRTPIQPILGLTQVLSSRIKNTEEAELLKVVSRNAKRLQQLTEDILDVTRIESNSLVSNKEQFKLNEVIANAINDTIANTGSFGIRKKENIKILYEPNKNKENIIVEADKARIAQVISNLLNNAVKFTPEEEKGGTISVILEENRNDDDHKEKEVIVKIKDTGIGIDPEIKPRLFTRFATKSEKGTGLGLYISKSIVQAHGGRMWAENNADGKGATFYFSLPISSG